MKKLLLGLALSMPMLSYGIDIKVTNISCGGLGGAACTQLDEALNTVINEDLPEVSLGKYATGIANSTGFAFKGLGSDYSDNFSYFMIRGGGGVAVQGDLDKADSADGVGIGAQATVGVNLDLLPIDKVGPVDLSKMDLFFSIMSYSVDQDVKETSAELDLGSFGVFARYQIMEGKDIIPGYMLEWGGVHLHTGIQRASIEGDLTQKFDDQTADIGGGQTATLSNASANFNLESSTTSIPVEVSTYLRAAYVFTFFGGAGFDLNSGKTDIDLKATGTATGSPATGGYSSSLQVTEGDDGKMDATNFRAFAGMQFNIPFVRVFMQVNKGLGNDLMGINAGAKILW